MGALFGGLDGVFHWLEYWARDNGFNLFKKRRFKAFSVCVGERGFATVNLKFLSKLSFMMVELIKCLVKWTISSGDSIFFSRMPP